MKWILNLFKKKPKRWSGSFNHMHTFYHKTNNMEEQYILMRDAVIKIKMTRQANEADLMDALNKVSNIIHKYDGKTESEQLQKQKKVRDRPSKI
jgi:hypothetical protein